MICTCISRYHHDQEFWRIQKIIFSTQEPAHAGWFIYIHVLLSPLQSLVQHVCIKHSDYNQGCHIELATGKLHHMKETSSLAEMSIDSKYFRLIIILKVRSPVKWLGTCTFLRFCKHKTAIAIAHVFPVTAICHAVQCICFVGTVFMNYGQSLWTPPPPPPPPPFHETVHIWTSFVKGFNFFYVFLKGLVVFQRTSGYTMMDYIMLVSSTLHTYCECASHIIR